MTSQRLRLVLSILIFLLSLIGIAFYLWDNKQLVTLLTNLSLKTAVVLIILRLIFVGFNGLFLKLYSAKLNVHLRWYEWIGLPYITTMGNYLTPLSGGMLARAVYLKNRHALSYTNFTMLLAANYLITFWVVSLTALFIIPFLWQQTNAPWLLVVFFIVCWGLLTAILLMPIPRLVSTKRPVQVLNQALLGWQAVKDDRCLIWQLLLLTIASLLLNAAAFWLSYWVLQVTVSVPMAIMISISAVFSALVTVTPGNFGIREAFVSFMSAIVGVGAGTGLLVALLIRGGTLVSVFILGPLFAAILTREIRLAPMDHSNLNNK
jgi:uncharacterized membrane protein YbhN (UPF0104 family)